MLYLRNNAFFAENKTLVDKEILTGAVARYMKSAPTLLSCSLENVRGHLKRQHFEKLCTIGSTIKFQRHKRLLVHGDKRILRKNACCIFQVVFPSSSGLLAGIAGTDAWALYLSTDNVFKSYSSRIRQLYRDTMGACKFCTNRRSTVFNKKCI